jgi:hypothetical protein
MIYIEKSSINKFVLTLTESSQLVDPFYLFEFKADFDPTREPIYFTTDDESLSTCRYNLFTLEENSSGSTTGGTSVALSLEAGQYRYNVYESTASTLSVSATTGTIIETGRMTSAFTGGTQQQITNFNNNIYL